MRPAAALVFALVPFALAQEPASIDSFLDSWNRALHTNPASLAAFFAPDSEYRVGGRTVALGPEATVENLLPRPLSGETRPRLENASLFPISTVFALVTARQVSYGSLILKRSQPVVLLLQNTESGWRIVVWSVPEPPLAVSLPPPRR